MRQAERETKKLKEGRERILASVMQAEATGNSQGLPYLNLLVRKALVPLAERIELDVKTAGERAGAYKKFSTYLGGLDAKIVALRAIQAVLEALLAEGAVDQPQPVKKKIAYSAGRAVYFEYLMQHFSDINPPLFNSLIREYSRSMTKDEQHLITAFRTKYQNEGYQFPLWEFGIIEHVGHYLVEQLRCIGFVEVWNQVERKHGRATIMQYIRLDEDLRYASLDLLDRVADLPRATGPLIEPPLPWDATTNTKGGFHSEGMQRLLAYAVQGRGVGPVSDSTVEAINNLQARRWQINTEVLDVVQQAAGLFDFGDVVSPIRTEKPTWTDGDSEEEKAAYRKAAREWYTERALRAAKHLRQTKAIREGQELRDEPAIWFAYYADFRGRLYARASGVSPQGTDLEKGLIRFAQGKYLSEEGKPWFLIHGANKFGVDKVSYEDRIKWVREHHQAIMTCAADPINMRWWTEADCPVQFLAWVLEYREWHTDPLTFLTHLPVSLDGTCNGLQNFSALLRDEVGGRAVNLLPGPKPNDIYAQVAQKATHILNTMPTGKFRDAWLAHGLNRKVTKRPTMTLPYGCTRFACSEFIVSDYLEKVLPEQIERADFGDAGNFLSHVVWQAIGETVIKAREAMDWLKGWAKFCLKTDQPVRWTTPNGLEVKSQYSSFRPIEVKSVAFKSRALLYRGDPDKVDPIKVVNAVAPNFIHSMDACHLARVVNRATREGMDIAAIHDDFGVHASDTPAFARIIREEFVRLYEESNPLQAMADFVGYDVPPPKPGSLDLKQVLESPYFFG